MSGWQMLLQKIYWKLVHWSPIAWAFILLFISLVLVKIDTDFTKKLAILPGVVAILLLYQALFRRKMY